MSEFRKTVDLSEKMAPKRSQSFDSPPKRKLKKKKVTQKALSIDKVFNDEPIEETENEKEINKMHKISRPSKSESDDGFYKKLSTILALLLFATIVYFMFFSNAKEDGLEMKSVNAPGWYSVKLMNDETYYGEIKDTTTDPIVIENVYYNYDQINAEKTGEVAPESANLRLVKRGKETHGPDGTMSVVRVQVVFMELLKDDSKVLKAILDYEK